MINPFQEINWKPGTPELHKFSWSLIIGFPCLAALLFLAKWLTSATVPEPAFYLTLGGAGALIGAISRAILHLARPLYVIWYSLACCIGIVVANLLFVVLYYGLFTPIGLIMRLMGRDALKLKFQRGTTSYWLDAKPVPPPAQYFRQY